MAAIISNDSGIEMDDLSTSQNSAETIHFLDLKFTQNKSSHQFKLYKEGLFTDVILKCSDREIPCHKLTLASASPFLEAKFRSSPQIDEVDLSDVSPSIFLPMITFFYTGGITITTKNVQAIVQASEILELQSLKSVCDDFIKVRIEPENVMGTLMFAKHYQLQASSKAAEECMLQSPDLVFCFADDSEFKELDEQTLVDWISAHRLNVSSEATTFDLVQKWVQVLPCRMNEMTVTRVLSHVHLEQCSPAFLVNVVGQSPLIQYPATQRQFHQAKDYILLKEAGESTASMQVKPPRLNAYKSHIVVLGGGTVNKRPNMLCWSLQEGEKTWKELSRLPEAQQPFTYAMKACVLGEWLIITGGTTSSNDDGRICSNAWKFSLHQRQWIALPSMNYRRSDHGIAIVDQHVYVFGGTTKLDEDVSPVEMLDEGKGMWIEKAPIPHYEAYLNAYNINGNIHVLSYGNDRFRTYMYDVDGDVWKVQYRFRITNSSTTSAFANIGEQIYCVAGYEEWQSYCYDTQTGYFSKILAAKLPRPHICACALGLSDNVLLCGGSQHTDDDENMTGSMVEYDPRAAQWSPSDMCLPRKLVSHCMVLANIA